MKHFGFKGDYKALEKQYKSWKGDKKKYNAYHTLKNLDKLYKELMEMKGKERNVKY